jgi:hypothetical protein
MANGMKNELIRHATPEELELIKKKAELSALQTTLAENELRLTTLHAELGAFEGRYMRIVGVRLAELDEIQAQIAEVLARNNPADTKVRQEATDARTQANESAKDAGEAKAGKRLERFVPSDRLKKLYRDLAKRIHPDLATEEEELVKRNALMARANRAYEVGDEDTLEAILRDWDASPDSVKGDGMGADLVRVIRKIAQVENRLRQINNEMEQLKNYDLYQLKTRVEEGERNQRDILAEMVARVDKDIVDARSRLSKISISG